jgi:hypothetical protein
MLQNLDDHVAHLVLDYAKKPNDLAAIARTCKKMCTLIAAYKLEVITTICTQNPMLANSLSAQEVAMLAMSYNRIYDSNIALIGGDGYERQFDTLDTSGHTFSRRCGMGIKRSQGSALVCHAGLIFAISGLLLSAPFCVEAYDILRNVWVAMPQLPAHLCHVSATSVLGRLYVIGGAEGLPNTVSDHIYELQDQPISRNNNGQPITWRCVAPDNFRGRYSHGSVSFKDRVWIAGGYNRNQEQRLSLTKSVQIFDPRYSTISAAPPMCETRLSPTLLVVCGQLFAVGGDTDAVRLRSKPATIERFDESMQAWSIAATLPFEWRVETAAAVGRRIYVFGSAPDVLGTALECVFDFFDVQTERWGSVEAGLGTPETGCFPIPAFTRQRMRYALAVAIDLNGHPSHHS